jgi:hypothetical protein
MIRSIGFAAGVFIGVLIMFMIVSFRDSNEITPIEYKMLQSLPLTEKSREKIEKYHLRWGKITNGQLRVIIAIENDKVLESDRKTLFQNLKGK